MSDDDGGIVRVPGPPPLDLSTAITITPMPDPPYAPYLQLLEPGTFEVDHERHRLLLSQVAADRMRNGFGDPDAPLQGGEYVHEAVTCPVTGCGWWLAIEWRSEHSGAVTRWRGMTHRDRLAIEHLAEHGL